MRGDLKLSGLSISVDRDTGEVSAGDVTVWLRSDVWPSWLKIAATSLADAFQARLRNEGVDTESFNAALDDEFRASMTSLCASAFALEAFANSVHHHVPASKVAGRSADARIHQTLQRAFRLSNAQSKAMRTTMQQVFRLRDRAVHPSAAFAEPLGHPVFKALMEPRFVNFRTENVATAYRFAYETITSCLSAPRPVSAEFLEWCSVMTDHVSAKAPTPETNESPRLDEEPSDSTSADDRGDT